MNNSIKVNSPFDALIKYKGYKNIFIAFFLVIVIPTLIIKSFLVSTFYLPAISYGISALLYMAMFLFVNSFIVLYGLAGGKRFSFFQVISFIPSIIPVIILPTLIFTVLIIIAQSIFMIAPFILFIALPIVSFAPLFSKRIALSEIVDNNKSFLKKTMGKALLRNTIVLSVILVVVLFILKNLFWGLFGFFSRDIKFLVSLVINGLLYMISYSIMYITIVNSYSTYSFILPDNLYGIGNDIISKTKNTRRKKRDISSKKHSHKKESYQENIFDFEKEDKKLEDKKQKSIPKSKERNRFLDDEGFNRFEDTKF